jgi:hypothetical protein
MSETTSSSGYFSYTGAQGTEEKKEAAARLLKGDMGL